MNRKSTLVAMLCIALILSIVSGNIDLLPAVQAASQEEQLPQIRLAPSATHVEVGDTVEVAIWLQGFTGDHSDIEGFEIHMDFDPTLLQPVAQQKNITPTLFPATNQVMTLINEVDEKGSIKIGQALTQRTNGLFSGYGKVGVITFQAKKAGEATLSQTKSIIIKPNNPGVNIIHTINHPTIVIGGQASSQSTGKEKKETVGTKPKHVETPLSADKLLQAFKDYQDIAKLSWSTDAIAKLAENKVIQGTSEGKFEPRRNMTRAEFAKMAVIALGLDMKQQQVPTFSDIQKTDWFYDYVETAVQYGLIQGSVQNGKKVFLPQSTITRAEISAILSRALEQVQGYHLGISSTALHTFEDVRDSHWAKKDIDLLAAHGLMKGRADTHFAPNEQATRAEVSVLLVRLLEFKPE